MPYNNSKHKGYELPHPHNIAVGKDGEGDVMRIRRTIEKIDADMHTKDQQISHLKNEIKRLKIQKRINHN